jgi:uncharacterized membrane protein YqhA
MLKRLVEQSRYLVVLAVLASLAATLAAFLWGTWKTGLVLWWLVQGGQGGPPAAFRFIELIDTFLVAAGLYIFAVGMHDLFLGGLDLPQWLDVHSLHDIKARLSSILVLVMAITFLERVVLWEDPSGTLRFGIAISLVAVTLIAFNRYSEPGQ